ncbi:expressed unknown protein [Seminavis robusta]|uniref:Uncharacterized protein n=1 Tax=Seminavis robusta TaxID=568900 RepID=A0A9N8D885_9STRA|nr:expressed unknown protein [Seminavis robusta]|eukprot:Sro33_g021630.1 n/a (208) ;mRNA; f:124722-125345
MALQQPTCIRYAIKLGSSTSTNKRCLCTRQLLLHVVSAHKTKNDSHHHFSWFQKNTNKKKKNDNGNGWLLAGAVLMGLVVVEQSWHTYKDYETKTQFQAIVIQMQQDANRQAGSISAEWNDPAIPALFECTVMETHPSLDGTKMLRGVKVGDTVDVLATGVGPDQAYSLCRLVCTHQPASDAAANEDGKTVPLVNVGWYPKFFLKEL